MSANSLQYEWSQQETYPIDICLDSSMQLKLCNGQYTCGVGLVTPPSTLNKQKQMVT